MRLLMEKLELKIKTFILRRRVKIQLIEKYGQKALLVEGVDHDGTPFSLFTDVEFTILGKTSKLKAEPFIVFLCSATGKPWYEICDKAKSEVKITLMFNKHYGEPNAEIIIPLQGLTGKEYLMSYNPVKEDRSHWDSITPL